MAHNICGEIIENSMDAQSYKVSVPNFEKSQLKPGIAHFGPGYFHRGHLAVIMNQYMHHTGDLNWGIVGITLHDPEKAAKLAKQEFNYHAVERSAAGGAIREIRSILDIMHAPNDKQAVIDLLASPDIKLITMTITQKGYVKPEGGFEGGDPNTVAGYIVHALEKRRQNGIPAPTLMSCDNIPANGAELKAAVLHQSSLFAGLADWINDNVKFPDTMVDRIVPATKPEDVTWLKDNFGIDDPQAIFTEPFRQLVIQDRFSGPFPNIARSGIAIHPDVKDYELMKIRMLNGTHFAMGVVGTLAGYKYIDDALQDPVLREFAQEFMGEAAGSLKPIDGVDYADYQQRLFTRFDNPHMKDELVRLARNGSDKLRPRAIDTARDLMAGNKDYRMMALVAAAWAHYVKGYDANGKEFDILDEKAVKAGWQNLARSPQVGNYMTHLADIFGADMSQHRAFRHAYGNYYMMIQGHGIKKTLEHVLKNPEMAVVVDMASRRTPKTRRLNVG